MFFTRRGGVSKGVFESMNCRPCDNSDDPRSIAMNREIARQALGAEALLTLVQRHTDKILLVDRPLDMKAVESFEGDGIITNQKKLAIGVLTADCVPVLIASSDGKWVGAVHCGWQGLVAGIPSAAVRKFAGLGYAPQDLRIAFGPCLKRQNYEVAADFIGGVSKVSGVSGKSLFSKRKNGKYLFDCAKFCRREWEKLGIRKIEILLWDTYAEKDLFFSYRRDVQTGCYANGNPLDSGRQLSAIMIK
jgi:YfiH family protein